VTGEVIGVDTNVLVRYIVQDDLRQARLATRFMNSLTRSEPGFVSAITLTETSWVLARRYQASGEDIAKAVELLLAADVLIVEHAESVHRALDACRRHGAGFADAFVAAIGRDAGCAETVTFDKNAAKRAGMRLLR